MYGVVQNLEWWPESGKRKIVNDGNISGLKNQKHGILNTLLTSVL